MRIQHLYPALVTPSLWRSSFVLLLLMNGLIARVAGDGWPLTTFQLPDFVGSGSCASCHSSLTDAAGNDVSMDAHWRSTLMAHAGKDPFWQAKVASEIVRNPALKPLIEDKCSTCHFPMARTQAVVLGAPVRIFDDGFLDPANPYHPAAMDGVACALCHQVRSDNLGLETSFSGNYVIDTSTFPPYRMAYGPFVDPFPRQMQSGAGFTPVFGPQFKDSAVCAVCHNLRTPYVDAAGQVQGLFPEQMIYSEWQHSTYSAPAPLGRSCQDCHMPPAVGGVRLSNRNGPRTLPLRSPYGRHHFVGGNVFMLDLLAANVGSLKLTASSDQLAATQQRTLVQLQEHTATLQAPSVDVSEAEIELALRVENLVGHKLPAGLPSRRAWLHVEVRDGAGQVFFSSGKPQPDGRIQGDDLDLSGSDCEPHYDVITQPHQVQIYEAVMEDTDGAVTYTLLRAARYRKDNRLLPSGFDALAASPDIAPAGEVLLDANFTGGQDELTYRIARSGRQGPFSVSVRLHYQTLSFGFAADLFTDSHPAIARFAELYEDAGKEPVTLAQLEIVVPGS